ncbi:hypothetical protein ABFX02_05G086500 [Erythranthe guttata]
MQGSLWTANIFIKTRVFFGIVYPPIVEDSVGDLGIRMGAGGYKRSVSLIIASKYFNFGIWNSSTMLFDPTTSDNSFCALLMSSGLFIRSAIAHSTVLVVLSVPPPTISYIR